MLPSFPHRIIWMHRSGSSLQLPVGIEVYFSQPWKEPKSQSHIPGDRVLSCPNSISSPVPMKYLVPNNSGHASGDTGNSPSPSTSVIYRPTISYLRNAWWGPPWGAQWGNINHRKCYHTTQHIAVVKQSSGDSPWYKCEGCPVLHLLIKMSSSVMEENLHS